MRLPASLLVLLACSGEIGDPSATPIVPPSPTPDVVCTEEVVAPAALLRIDRATYVNALETLFGDEALDPARGAIEALPEAVGGRYSSATGAPSFTEVSAYVDIASAVAFEVDPATVAPCLAELEGVLPATDECVAGFLATMARRVLRRPPSEEDLRRFAGAYEVGAPDGVHEGVSTMLLEMLLDPRFLYFFEVDGTEVRPGVLALSSHELAARLARTLWSSVPDDELQAAADVGLEGALLEEQLQRMWADPRSADGLRRFYREWLHLDDGSTGEASLAFLEALTRDDATWADLLLDRRAFVGSDELAATYGLPDGTRGEVELDDRRAGILTRAGWLETIAIPATDAGHLIHRGARVGELLCNPLPPPDPNLFPAEDPAEPGDEATSIRSRFSAATAQPRCSNCHERLDAYGAPFGHFGADGEWLDEERLEALDATAAIDASSVVELDGERVEVDGALAFSELIAHSPQAAACFGDALTERFVGRPLDPGDGCLRDAAHAVLADPDAEPGSVREAIFALLGSDHFAMRTLPEER